MAGNYLGYVENRPFRVHVTKREKKNLKIAGRVSHNKTFGLSLLCLCFLLSPPPFFFPCIFCGEADIFVSAGDTLIETKINKSAEKLTPTAHSRALKTRL